MAEADWGFFGASAGDIKRGVTAGFTPPKGGRYFVFGFRSQVAGNRASGIYKNAENFGPLRNDAGEATGGSVRAALKRGRNGYTASGYSIAMFLCLQGTPAPSETEQGYLLGLSDGDPSNVVLAKGLPNVPLQSGSTGLTILATSSVSYSWDTWLHLRLDAIVNPNGDVVLSAYASDLAVNEVTAPNWEAIDGLDTFIDDALGINSNSNPLAGGYGGIIFQSSQAYRSAFADHFVMWRQT